MHSFRDRHDLNTLKGVQGVILDRNGEMIKECFIFSDSFHSSNPRYSYGIGHNILVLQEIEEKKSTLKMFFSQVARLNYFN